MTTIEMLTTKLLFRDGERFSCRVVPSLATETV